jgi:arylsulfatase A-like enzyme
LVSTLDIGPTILDYLGFERNEDFMGLSLMPLINGEEEGYNREGIISEIIPVSFTKLISYRTKKYKLIIDRITNNKELFDLENDPQELSNIYNSEPEIVKNLTKKIVEFEIKKESMINKVEEMKKIDSLVKNIKF